MQLHPDFGRTLRLYVHSREECRAHESYGLQKDSQKTFRGDLIGDFFLVYSPWERAWDFFF